VSASDVHPSPPRSSRDGGSSREGAAKVAAGRVVGGSVVNGSVVADAPAAGAGEVLRPGPSLAGQHVLVLEQSLEIYSRLTPELYTQTPVGVTASAAGGHFRHIHDYYRCFLDGLSGGRVDYDLRRRDPRFERDLEHAAGELRRTVAELQTLTDPNLELSVKMDADETPGAPDPWSRSTVGRELRFLLSHTIHHFALIAMILEVQGFRCGPGFGVAPSTIKYWQITQRSG
jgi:uncharacterized damage-inducible protein DinB